MFNSKKSLLYVAVALCITACGGSDDGNYSAPPGGTTPPEASVTSSGKVVDGYIIGATVFCDLNKNGIADTGEASTPSDATGNFKFDPGCAGTVVATGGNDSVTGYAFNGTLKSSAGSAVTTPLTSLVTDTGMTTVQLAAAVGLPAGTDVTQLDPADGQHQDLLKTTLAVQQIVQQLANMFAGLAGSTDLADVYSEVGASLAQVLLANPGAPLVGQDRTVNLTVVNAAATAALASLQADPRYSSIVISAADLATAAGLIGAQAQRFATASDADLLSLVTSLQNPANQPVNVNDAVNYLALQNDSVKINGVPITYAALTNGVTISTPATFGLDFQVHGSPSINTAVSLGLQLVEVGGQYRTLQLMIDKVNVVNTAGQLSINPDASAKVYVYGKTSGGGSEINLTLNNLGFKPITVVENSLVLNYKALVDKVLASVDNTTQTTADKFTAIYGTFNITVAASGLAVRSVDGQTALPTTTVSITNTAFSVNGPGVSGLLNIPAP